MSLVSSTPKISQQETTFDRIIAYMDLDAFFAAVEVRENPRLAGKPIVVGGDPITKKGVVATCSYEARKYGIHSGMPASQAAKLCPHVIFVRRTHGLYSKVSESIMTILKRYSPKVKVSSIDEAYFDLTEIVNDYAEAKQLAYELKDDIFATEQITCTIGIAPNKILAKIASGADKPDGLTVVRPLEIKEFLSPLNIRHIPGIGKKAEAAYNDIGIYTCGDLAKYPVVKLYNKSGKYALKLWKLTNGYNTQNMDEKFTSHNRKSISEERTFFEPHSSWEQVWYHINKAIKTIVMKAKERNMQYRTVTLKIRNRDFDTYTRSHSLPCYSISEEHARKIIEKLLAEYSNVPPSNIRLIGVKISNLRKTANKQKSLAQFFNKKKEE